MKKFKIIAYVMLLIVIIVLSLTIYTSATQENQQESENEKVFSEIKYLDLKFVDLFNNMNNIETRNYRIFTNKTEESKSAEFTDEGKSSTKQENNETNSDSNSTSDSGSSSEGDSNTSSSEKENKNNSVTNYQMTQSGILTSNRDIDWSSCKNELELIYTSISTITLDLYKINVAQEDILNFNKEMDNLTATIQKEDKQETLNQLVKTYNYISKFTQNINCNQLYKIAIETKTNVFTAYAKLEENKWKEMDSDVSKAIETYSTLLTSSEIDENKQSNVNKGYVMLNELKSSISMQDKSVFLIKYKNLLEELENV